MSSVFALSSLPELYKIKQVQFAGPYGCVQGYNGSALFLSDEDRRLNNPILLYYGICPPQQATFICAMSGNSLANIADLGTKTLSSFTANDAIYATNFQDEAPVVSGHTYFAIIARDDLRAMLAFSVDNLNADGSVDLSYALMMYEQHQIVAASPGWSWNAHNSQ